MPAGITWANHGADAGDLITAAYTLGVPHPSGYPTYTLIGWFFSKLPVGSIAWRFNLLSATGAAGGAWLLFKIVLQLTGSRVAGLLAAWSLAFTPLVWSQVIITEVYGVNLFFVGLLLWLGLQVRQGRTRYIFWLGLVFGLSLGVHLTNLFLLPVLGWFLYKGSNLRFTIYDLRTGFSVVNRKSKIVNSDLVLLLGLGAGLLVFAYLPLRAGRGGITWGEPHTLIGFWELVSGQIYHQYLFSAPLHLLGPRILTAIRHLSGTGLFSLILAGVGLRWLWYHARDMFWGGLATVGLYLVYALGYNTIDSYVYFLPVFIFIGLWVGVGAKDILDAVSAKPYRPLVVGGLLAVPLLLVLLNAPRLSLRDDTAAEEFWQWALAEAPPEAVLLTSRDDHTLTLWYAHFVLHQRPDVVVVDTRLVAYPWHQSDLQRARPELTDLPNLTTIFEQKGDYHRPLCSVSEEDFSCIGEW